MKDVVRVAAVQMEVKWLDVPANLARMREAVARLATEGDIDLVVFPELASSGYLKGKERKDFMDFSKAYLATAQLIPGPFTDSLGKAAQKYGTYIVAGMLEAHPSVPATIYNSAVLVAPSGEVAGVHRKPHIPSEEKHYFYPGNTTEVYDTDIGGLGILICADNSFPEIARVLSLKGAEIMCVCYARPRGTAPDPNLYYSIVSCRAYENNNFFIACNRVGTEEDTVFEGRSCICGPRGEFLARSDSESEEVLTATLKADDLKTARMRYSRFRDRRPELYDAIVEPF
ncbi:MAG: carbon-nitrogen hydrolase family protein [Chloroflexota bacterium]